MVAGRHHPRDGAGDGLVLLEEQVPVGRVVAVRLLAQAVGVGVADVAGVEVEGGVLAQDDVVVGGGRVAHALVAEGREHERPGVRRRRTERADRRAVGRRGRVEALVADAVVVRRAGVEAVQGRVDVVLLDGGAYAREPRGVQVADLGGDPAAEVVGLRPHAYVRLPDRERDLPGDPHRRLRVGAEGEMAAEGDDRRAGHLGGGGDGSAALPSADVRSAQPASSPPAATAPADTSARRRDSFARRYSYCSAMLIRTARCSGMPTSGVSMSMKFP